MATCRFMEWARRRAAVPVVFVAVLLAGVLSGCLVPGGRLKPGQSVSVSVAKDGSLSVRGRSVSLSSLGSKLKSMGGTKTTPVKILTDQRVTRSTVSSVTRRLRGAGFSRIKVMRKDDAIVVNVDETGRIRVRDQDMRLDELAMRLKMMGASRLTRIDIKAHRSVSDTTLNSIRQRLISGGLPKVVTAKQRHAEVILHPKPTR